MAATSAHADVRVKLKDEDLLGLHILAALDGVAQDDPAGFADAVTATMRRGIRTRFDAAGLAWPPGPGALERASAFAAIAAEDTTGTTEAASTPRGRPPVAWSARRATVAAALIVVSVVVLVGGYALDWSWTGLPGNDQLWDWMHLLLLPVALGTFPLWLSYSGYMSAARRRVLAGAVLAFFLFVLIGYVAPLVWTGFRGQTLWDWLVLVLLPLALVSVQAWPSSGREIRRHHVALAIALLAAWAATLIGGYMAGWAWTGYAGNTLWDWVSLLLAPVAITTVVVPLLVRRVSGDAVSLAEADTERRARDRAIHEARVRARAADEGRREGGSA